MYEAKENEKLGHIRQAMIRALAQGHELHTLNFKDPDVLRRFGVIGNKNENGEGSYSSLSEDEE